MKRTAAYTMIELLTVLAILGTLLALSAGVYFTFKSNMEVRGAAGRIIGMIQTAHNTALSQREPVFLLEKNTYIKGEMSRAMMISFANRAVGQWHFDDESNIVNSGYTQGYGGNLTVTGSLFSSGRIGGGIQMNGSSLTCTFLDEFTPSDGVGASLWIKLNRLNEVSSQVTDCSLVQMGASYNFYVSAGQLSLDLGGKTLKSTVGTDPFYIYPDRWTYVSFSYDVYTRRIVLSVDNVERGSYIFSTDTPVQQGSNPTFCSGLMGSVDEIKLTGVLQSETYDLPGGLIFDIPENLAGSVPYVQVYTSGDEKTYWKVTAFDDKGWLDSTFGGSGAIGFHNVTYGGDPAYARSFSISRQGIVQAQ